MSEPALLTVPSVASMLRNGMKMPTRCSTSMNGPAERSVPPHVAVGNRDPSRSAPLIDMV